MIFDYLRDPAHWQGDDGISMLLATHLGYTFGALVVAAVLGIPLGLFIGGTRAGLRVARALDGVARPIPALVLLVIAVLLFAASFLPVVAALALIAIPGVVAATARGVGGVNRPAVTAARALGMSGVAVVRSIVAPLALPSIVFGLRRAAVQIAAAAALAAVAGAGGLGRLIVAGNAARNYSEMFTGALLIAALALLLYVVFGLLGWSARRRSRQLGSGRTLQTGSLHVG